MECSRCKRPVLTELGPNDMCDACVAADPAIYYSAPYLAVIERRLEYARGAARTFAERGIGHDVRSNPTKGRARLNELRIRVESLQSTRRLIRAALLSRGEVEPTVEERLERAFPEAKNREIVELDGKRYEHRWVHEGVDHGGANLWGRTWTPIGDT